MIYAREIDAALGMLRRGRAVVIEGDGGRWAALGVEFASEASLAAFDPAGERHLLVTRARIQALGYTIDGEEAGEVLAVDPNDAPDLAFARALANPLADSPHDPPGFALGTSPAPEAGEAAIRLAKLSEMLPAVFVRPATADEGPAVEARAILAYAPAESLRIVSSNALPVDVDEGARLMAFGGSVGADLHLALLIGEWEGNEAPLVRLHSECLTGDVFGSLKCDCGPQLAAAKRHMREAGGGILLYLRQEGRKIGLANKMRAYSLQERGLDTEDANLHIGFGADERDYAIAARMLQLLGVRHVRLLSNNPAKVEALESAGIRVVERLPLPIAANPHNARYLATKRDRSGHLLP